MPPPSHGMAVARTVLILSKSASLQHKSDATRLHPSPVGSLTHGLAPRRDWARATEPAVGIAIPLGPPAVRMNGAGPFRGQRAWLTMIDDSSLAIGNGTGLACAART